MSIKTKYGMARYDAKRGYRISSTKENNLGKMVHRLVWEEHYGKIPKNAYVIFKDNDNTNFDISNLELKFKVDTFPTKYGDAWINHNGYVSVYSNGEKLLHRLIWEEHNGEIPKGYQIHHIDKNKLNNDLNNLQLVNSSEHTKLHMTGESNPHYNKELSLEHKLKLSDARNETGYYRVAKQYSDKYSQGFRYRYIYTDENGKRKEIKSVDINKLKEKVLDKGLPWIKLDE